MIFNQGQKGQCKGYSFLTALAYMGVNLDYSKIDKELQGAKPLLTGDGAGKWFKERGYIADFFPVPEWQEDILLPRGIALVTGASYGDFSSVKSPEFVLEFSKKNKQFSHSHTRISKEKSGLYRHRNSWGESWGEHGDFFIRPEDRKFLVAMYRIVPKYADPHREIVSQYIWDKADYDNKFGYQCVDWIKEYCFLRGRPVMTFGNASEYAKKGLGNGMKWIPNTLLASPKEGDVIVWDTTWGGGYGHIAIANGFCNPAVLRYVDQNGGKGSGTGVGKDAIQNRFGTYKGVLGWFTV